MTYLFITVFLYGGIGLVMALGDGIGSLWHLMDRRGKGHYFPGCDRCKSEVRLDWIVQSGRTRAQRYSAEANRWVDAEWDRRVMEWRLAHAESR